MSKTGIVNVRMVITEEKVISNIDKVQKMINPKNKKSIIQLEEDTYFKDLIESIKTYLIEYPNKKKFPVDVYNAAYNLVEFAINQFEENTKKVEELIKQREKNIALAGELTDLIEKADTKQIDLDKDLVKVSKNFSEEIIENLKILSKCKTKTSQKYTESIKVLKAKVNNLEANLHIEIDMERLEDSSKALSFIGIEISDALKLIPTPEENIIETNNNVSENVKLVEEKKIKEKKTKKVKADKNVKVIEEKIDIIDDNKEAIIEDNVKENIDDNIEEYQNETTFEVKPSFWNKITRSKLFRAATYIFRIRIRIELPSNTLPEGSGE